MERTHFDLHKKQKKLKQLVRDAMVEHKNNDRRSTNPDEAGRRIERLARKAERIERFLSENEPKLGRMGKEI